MFTIWVQKRRRPLPSSVVSMPEWVSGTPGKDWAFVSRKDEPTEREINVMLGALGWREYRLLAEMVNTVRCDLNALGIRAHYFFRTLPDVYPKRPRLLACDYAVYRKYEHIVNEYIASAHTFFSNEHGPKLSRAYLHAFNGDVAYTFGACCSPSGAIL